MLSKHLRFLGLCALCAVAVGASASGCGVAAGVVSDATLTIYNGQHPQTTDALVAAFTERTGIKVRVLSDDEDILAAQLQQEGSRSPADIYYTENSNWLALVDAAGLLTTVDRSTLANVPRQDSAADGDWVGVTARVSCMIYNTKALRRSQLPRSIIDLEQPIWQGKIGLDSGETDFWPLVVSVDHTYGHAAAIHWLVSLKTNAGGNAQIPDNETLTSDVNMGIVGLGLINQYYYYRLKAELGSKAMHSKIAYFAPGDPGYVENISGAGDPQVLQAQARRAGVPELHDKRRRPADHRPQRQLRVPAAPRRGGEPAAGPAGPAAPLELFTGRPRHRRARRAAA